MRRASRTEIDIMANVAALYTRPDENPARQAWVEGLSGGLTAQIGDR